MWFHPAYACSRGTLCVAWLLNPPLTRVAVVVPDTWCCSSILQFFVHLSVTTGSWRIAISLFLFPLSLFLDGPDVLTKDKENVHLILDVTNYFNKYKNCARVWTFGFLKCDRSQVRAGSHGASCPVFMATSRCIMGALKHGGISLHTGWPLLLFLLWWIASLS